MFNAYKVAVFFISFSFYTGLLSVGDTILEINGFEVHSPVDLQQQLNKSNGSVTFKIRPSNSDTIAPAQVSFIYYLSFSCEIVSI